MKVNFYVHSKSGNTLLVTNELNNAAISAAHETILTQIVPDDENQMNPDLVKINEIPDPSDADLIVLGGPVHGFCATPALIKAISSMGSLTGKRCVIYVTQSFPFNWMGGTHSIGQLEQLLSQKGASVISKTIIHWQRRDRGTQIEDFIEKFSTLLDSCN